MSEDDEMIIEDYEENDDPTIDEREHLSILDDQSHDSDELEFYDPSLDELVDNEKDKENVNSDEGHPNPMDTLELRKRKRNKKKLRRKNNW